MNKDVKILLAAGVFVIALLGGIFMFNLYQSNTNEHSADPGFSPANPARGLYLQIRSNRPDKLERLQGENMTLCLLAFDIYEYRDRELPEEKLTELQVFLEEAKAQQVQCIFRAAYGFDEEASNDAVSWDLVERHVEQISEVLNLYTDQIYCVQAGFLGPWGEWHHCRWTEDEEQAPEYRRALLKLLLDHLDPVITVDVRRPRFIREYGDLRRLGYHDDGLLSTHSDYGTYDDPDYDREQELKWLYKHIPIPHNGGEMPKLSEFSEPQNALKEFKQLKLSYLNSRYNKDVLEDWKGKTLEGQNAYTLLTNRLGYRYYVSKIRIPGKLRKGLMSLGQKATVTVSNEGFAPIDQRYHWELVAKTSQETRVLARFQPREKDTRDLSFGISGRLLRRIGDCTLGLRLVNDRDPENPSYVTLVNAGLSAEDGIHDILQVRNGCVLDLIPQ